MTLKIIHNVLLISILVINAMYAQSTTISGNTDRGNVTLSWVDFRSKIIVSDINGNYTISVRDGWTGRVTPTKEGYTFEPESRFYTRIRFDRNSEDYKATLNTYTINTSQNPLGGGTTSGAGIYDHGIEVNLLAIPMDGFTFVNWTENGIEQSRNLKYTFTANSNRNLIANFSLNNYTINTSANPSSWGTASGGGTFDHGELVTLIAVPNIGYNFINWTENGNEVSTNLTYSFIAESERNLVANFLINSYTIITSSYPFSGGITTGGGTFNHGELVNLIATPNKGYSFVNWTENGDEVSNNLSYSFNADRKRTLVANFLINNYKLDLSSSPFGSGQTFGSGNYDHGTLVEVIATPTNGWFFESWWENNQIISTQSNYSFTITKNRNFVANFSKKIYTVITSSNPESAGNTDGDGQYEHGSNVIIKASPKSGWNFNNWTENDNIIYSNSTANFTIFNNRNFVAHYSKKVYAIASSASPSVGGITNGASNYEHGDNVTLTATANSNAGYEFVNWTENGNEVSAELKYTFEANGNRTLVANFRLRTYSVEVIIDPNNSGTVTGTGTYTHGENVTIIAEPLTGWLFKNWADKNNPFTEKSTLTFNITGNKKLTANFYREVYSISASPQPVEGGLVTGTGSFFYGQTASIIAVLNPGWNLKNWTENGAEVSKDLTFQFPVNGSRELVANFELTNYSINCSVNPSDAGFTSGCGLSYYDQEMIVNAVSNDGWKFVNWTENGDTVSIDPEYGFSVTENRELIANFEIITVVNLNIEDSNIPENFYITNAFPNPFNPSTKIKFGLSESSTVSIFVVNTNGQIVRQIIKNTSLPAGNYNSIFNAENFSSGMYFLIFIVDSDFSSQNFKKVKKIILLK